MRRPLAVILLCAFLPVFAFAKIDLVTLPGRDITQLTIYKAEDLTLVRETRTLTFDEGKNEIQFSWANTLIDPTSLHIRLLDETSGFTLLDASYPANSQNTIVWNIEADAEGQAQVEITYFASGLNWQADYSAVANDDETMMRLQPNFTIYNQSGEDFENAQTRLVVGEINLVQAIRMLAQRGFLDQDEARELGRVVARRQMAEDTVSWSAFEAAPAVASMPMEAKEILKAAVSEYYLYSISGTEDIEAGWGKQLPDPLIEEIPIDVSYEYDPNKYGEQVIKFYKLKNNEEHELGDDPLPGGTYYVYSEDGRDGLKFEARTEHKYVPIGEDIELQLGNDGRVLVDKSVLHIERDNFDFNSDGDVIGHDVHTTVEIKITNSRQSEIPIKLRQYFSGDWAVEESNEDYKKIDQNTLEWEISAPVMKEKIIEYSYVTHMGSRAQTN